MRFPTDNYRKIGDVSFEYFLSELERVDSPLIPYAREMYDILTGYTALALAQMWQESQYETDRDLLKPLENPFNMKVWPEDPRGLKGIGAIGTKPTGVGGPEYLIFDSPMSAAKEYRRRIADDPSYKNGVYTTKYTLQQFIEDAYVKVDEKHPTTGVDNSKYYPGVVKNLTRYKAEDVLVATNFKKYIFPGLKNPVYLPDWIVVEFKLIPRNVAGWTSGQYINPDNFTSTTYHDTGNPNSNADSDCRWAANGGRASSPGSYNGIFDNKKLIITQRFDELVGHAANHTGNITSYAFEHAFGGAGNSFDASWKVGMWVHAGVLQAMGLTGTGAMYQHNFWSGKDCPGQIRRRNLWGETEQGVDERIAEINAYLKGDGNTGGGTTPDPKPEPKPTTPPVIEFLFGTADGYKFDPNGSISKAWLNNGEETGEYPRLVGAYETKAGDATIRYFQFSSGLVISANLQTGVVTPWKYVA